MNKTIIRYDITLSLGAGGSLVKRFKTETEARQYLKENHDKDFDLFKTIWKKSSSGKIYFWDSIKL